MYALLMQSNLFIRQAQWGILIPSGRDLLEMVQVQPAQASPYVPRPDGSEGIGSYARKVAQAGLGPMPHPKDVVYNHPVVRQHAHFWSCCAELLPRLMLPSFDGVNSTKKLTPWQCPVELLLMSNPAQSCCLGMVVHSPEPRLNIPSWLCRQPRQGSKQPLRRATTQIKSTALCWGG